MNQVQIFNFKNNEIRAVLQDGNPWWVAKDVCNVLGLKNPSDALKALDEDERARFNLGRQGEVNIINEPGLYSLILRSRKLEAKAFKRWITHEVIPAIRKTGIYVNDNQQAFVAVDKITEASQLVDFLRDHHDVLNENVNGTIQNRVIELLIGQANTNNSRTNPDKEAVSNHPLSATAQERPTGYSIKEIAAIAGVTWQKALGIVKKYNLQNEQNGVWYEYPYGGGTDRVFIYNRDAMKKIVKLIAGNAS